MLSLVHIRKEGGDTGVEGGVKYSGNTWREEENVEGQVDRVEGKDNTDM